MTKTRLWLDFLGDHAPKGYVYCKNATEVITELQKGVVEELAIDTFDPKVPEILDWLDSNPTTVKIETRPTITMGICKNHDAIKRKAENTQRK